MQNLATSKAKYLANTDVQDFATWLANSWNTATLSHQYINSRSGPWRCTSLSDALAKYSWPAKVPSPPSPGISFARNGIALGHLATQLASATTDTQMRDACVEVFRWGGVIPGNSTWVTNNLPDCMP